MKCGWECRVKAAEEGCWLPGQLPDSTREGSLETGPGMGWHLAWVLNPERNWPGRQAQGLRMAGGDGSTGEQVSLQHQVQGEDGGDEAVRKTGVSSQGLF